MCVYTLYMFYVARRETRAFHWVVLYSKSGALTWSNDIFIPNRVHHHHVCVPGKSLLFIPATKAIAYPQCGAYYSMYDVVSACARALILLCGFCDGVTLSRARALPTMMDLKQFVAQCIIARNIYD